MPFARWKNQSAIIATICVVGLGVLLSSQHRVRLIFGSYKEIDSVAQFDARLSEPGEMRFMPGVSIDSSVQQLGFTAAVSILSDFVRQHPPADGDDLPAIDDPDSCTAYLAQGRKLHCYNVDICACQLLARQGIPARMWDMNGPTELGGFGHNLLEVRDGERGTWRVLDPYYRCFFTLGSDSIPIGFSLLRRSLLASDTSLHIVRYVSSDKDRPTANILAELRYLAPCAMVHANNDFRSRFDHRYGIFMPLSSLLDHLPLRATRGVRMIMLGSSDRRFIIHDKESPNFPITTLKLTFQFLAILLLGSGGLFLSRLIVVRRTGLSRK